MILTSPPCLLRCRTWNKKTTEFAWTPLASCSSSLHQQQRSQSSLKVYGLAQLGKRGEDYGVWCQQLRPKCCKRGHRLLQHWRFRGGALWPRRDLRANWLRQLACGLSRVWHQLLVRWLCHNNRGSKSTAMRQQLQMHELYRSLGLGGAEMRRSHDLYVDGVLKHLHLIQWCVLQQSLCPQECAPVQPQQSQQFLAQQHQQLLAQQRHIPRGMITLHLLVLRVELRCQWLWYCCWDMFEPVNIAPGCLT